MTLVIANPVRLPTMPEASFNPVVCYLARLSSPRSRLSMRRALQRITRMLPGSPDPMTYPWPDLGPQHTAAIRSALAESFKPATANQSLSAVRGVLRECWRLGLMSRDGYARAADVKKVAGYTLPTGRHVTMGELRCVFEVCHDAAMSRKPHKRPAGVRDAAIFACFRCGLRRCEVIELNASDVSDDGLLVRGKGNKERRVPMDPGAEDAIAGWLELRGREDGPLFVPIDRGGALQREDAGALRAMSPQALHNLLKRRADQAGVQSVTPHDFRRTYIGDLLDAGADIVTVAGLVGHANVATTQRYDRRPDRVRAKAACMISTPYFR